MKNIIHKILNNNVIVCLNQYNQEVIIMGRGIGFKKRVGEPFDKQLEEKRFELSADDNASVMKDLLSEIPLEVVTTAEKIIAYAKEQLPGKLNNSLYISLTDHINFAISRFKQGLTIPNSFIWEIKKLYPQEYLVSLQALKIINQRLNVKLPEDEAGFIAFHLITAQLNDATSNIERVTKIIREILSIVKYFFNMEFDEDNLFYQRFVTHLKFFAQRVLTQSFVSHEDPALCDLFKAKYPQSYLCTEKISLHLSQIYQHPLTEDEKIFLTIHIERLNQNDKK
ncbi:PRD domain-containing protein [Utexia brackfieldae]|uniref:BglG family transcription antiterminator LicT n=1 Tax=Utexia brackfieldae TaxID=3074108 RepID=UPI00370DDD78